MGGWEDAIIARDQLRRAERIVSILVEEIDRKDQTIIRLQAERDAMRFELDRSRNQTASGTFVQGSDRNDGPVDASELLRNLSV